jgi:acetolactate decarboxylase
MSTLYQYSHFLAVSKGCYDGQLSISELKKHGDTGLGTFNALDGELIVIDNHFFHCSGGQVRIAQDNEMLPWAAVTTLAPENYFTVKGISSINELQTILFTNLPSINYPVALRITALAATISLGSVPKQNKPYRPISEVIDDSILINTEEMEVDMVGFYAPGFMFPIKSQGIHLHFVDKNRRIGGHVLELNLISAKICWQQINSINILLPQIDDYKNADLILNTGDNYLPKFENRLIINET